MRRLNLLILTVLLCSISLLSIDRAFSLEKPKLRVAVSILPQKDFVSWIGGNRVKVDVMVPFGANPHTFELKPSQLRKLSQTQLYFSMGTPIEFENTWLKKIKSVNKKMLLANMSRGIALIRTDHNHHHGHNDSSAVDPHVWLSPRNVLTMLKNININLAKIDPGNKSYYAKRLKLYSDRLIELDTEISAVLKGNKGNQFIVFHPSFSYFAKAYGLHQRPIEVWGKEPTAKQLKEIVDLAKRENIKVIFASPQTSSKSAETVASHIGGRVAYIDPLAENYIENIRRLARAFKQESR